MQWNPEKARVEFSTVMGLINSSRDYRGARPVETIGDQWRPVETIGE